MKLFSKLRSHKLINKCKSKCTDKVLDYLKQSFSKCSAEYTEWLLSTENSDWYATYFIVSAV